MTNKVKCTYEVVTLPLVLKLPIRFVSLEGCKAKGDKTSKQFHIT